MQLNTLILGDCLDVLRTFDDASVDLILTDPPYGISYKSGFTGSKPIKNDDLLFIWWLFDAYRILKPGGSMVCFTDPRTQTQWQSAIKWAGFDVRQQLVWYKDHFGAGFTEGDFAPIHEVAWFAVKGRHRFWFKTLGMEIKRLATVLRHAKPMYNARHDARFHPTQKPVDLFAELVEQLCPPSGIVIDPFAGAGTIKPAVEKAGRERKWIGIEIEPEYVEKALQRPAGT